MRFLSGILILGVLLVSCAAPPTPGQAPAPARDQAAPSRALVVAHRFEVSNLATKVTQTNGPLSTTRFFNATISLIDDQGVSRPYLVESLPEINSDGWRVFPDARMEVTYRLRDNLRSEERRVGKECTSERRSEELKRASG